jgi:uncharacterized protein
MTKPRIPRDLLDPVVEHFHPQRVILFGSRARGEATRDSDIDLLVIVDNDTPPEKLTWKAGSEAHRSSRAADVVPMCAADFERNRAVVNTLASEADIDGVVVYGSSKGSSIKRADPRARWEAVMGWLEAADADRKAAERCVPAGLALAGVVAFLCRQAVEKLLKGYLTLANKRGGKTHSLTRLGTAAAASFPEITDLAAAARVWSNWAFEFRYPDKRGGRKPPPDEAELPRAIEVIDALAAQLRAADPEPPG